MKKKLRLYIYILLAALVCAALCIIFWPSGQKEFYSVDGSLFKAGTALDEETLVYNIDALNAARAEYFPNAKTYYALIPDKNFFANSPTLDYDRIAVIADSRFFAVYSVSLFESLNAEAYYYTDGYWRQECLQPVVDRLGTALGFELDLEDFTKQGYPGYLGEYARLSGKKHEADLLFTLINLDTRSAEARDLLTGQNADIYAPELFYGDDPFSIYLEGSRALTDIANPEVETGKRLIVFGDDFARPLVPLLLHAYSEIVLIDLRYINWEDLGRYVDFGNADVLYLYNTAGLNTECFK